MNAKMCLSSSVSSSLLPILLACQFYSLLCKDLTCCWIYFMGVYVFPSEGFVMENLQGRAAATNSLTGACLTAHIALGVPVAFESKHCRRWEIAWSQVLELMLLNFVPLLSCPQLCCAEFLQWTCSLFSS